MESTITTNRIIKPWDRNEEYAESTKSLLEYRAFSRDHRGEIDVKDEVTDLLRGLAHLSDHLRLDLAENMKGASAKYLEDTDVEGKQFLAINTLTNPLPSEVVFGPISQHRKAERYQD